MLQLKAAADVKPPAEALEKAKGALPNSKFVEYDVANIAQVLEKIWEHVVEIIPKKGEQRLLYFPETAVLGNNAVVNRLVGHMEICRDCCDDFGNVVTLTVVPTTPTTMPLFLLKNVQSAAFSGCPFPPAPIGAPSPRGSAGPRAHTGRTTTRGTTTTGATTRTSLPST